MEKEFVEVEYDLSSSKSEFGEIAFIPADLVAQLGMKEAFNRHIGVEPVSLCWTENVTIDRYEIWKRGYIGEQKNTEDPIADAQ